MVFDLFLQSLSWWRLSQSKLPAGLGDVLQKILHTRALDLELLPYSPVCIQTASCIQSETGPLWVFRRKVHCIVQDTGKASSAMSKQFCYKRQLEAAQTRCTAQTLMMPSV